MKTFLFTILIVLSVVCFTQCTSEGITITNNPQSNDDGGSTSGDTEGASTPDSIADYQANDIRVAICESLDFCFSTVDETECLSDLDDDVSLLNVLDSTGSSADSFTEISALEESGGVTYAQAGLESCVTAIDALECDEFSTAGAYSNSFINDYTNVYRSLPSACEEVLQAE